jgi:tripartite-type tricarboxylate transporter receptor subunit TctC
VPYKGGAQIMTDVSAGALDLGLIDSSGAIPLIQAGKLRPIVVTGEKRNPFIDAPTMVESGYKDFITYSWTAFFVRGDTPEAIVKILSDAFTKVNASPAADEFRKQFSSEGMLLDAAGMRNFQLQEIERFKKIAQDAGIKPE